MHYDATRPPGSNAQRLRARDSVPAGSRASRQWRPTPLRSGRGRQATVGLVGALVALVAIAGVGALLYDRGRRDLIAPGVRVAGVDIGGLRLAAARERLRQNLVVPLESPVVVRVGRRSFHISARQAHVAVAVDALAQQALRASRRGWIGSRVVNGLDGARLNLDLRPQVSYSSSAVRHLALRLAARTHRPARDATVHPTRTGLRPVASRKGLEIQTAALIGGIEQALQRPGGGRMISAPMHVINPKVTTANLAARYPAYIIIDRAHFRLRFFHRLRLAHTYPIAVGRQGLATPAGLYDIQWKEVNPSWHVPNSSWAGALAGKTIPPGPQDPIKARWMAFNGGAGIHGTSDTGSLGSAASHGCIRMAIPDVIKLYPQVPVHTPVFVT